MKIIKFDLDQDSKITFNSTELKSNLLDEYVIEFKNPMIMFEKIFNNEFETTEKVYNALIHNTDELLDVLKNGDYYTQGNYTIAVTNKIINNIGV